MNETQIRDFWQTHPCGAELVGAEADNLKDFFDRYDRFRYGLERHIPACLDAMKVHGQDLLEIGLGQGADSEQLVRRGARWNGLDLTEESVRRVKTRLDLRGLSHGD